MKKKILLIDDDRELCEEYTDIFEAEGYYVKTEINGITGKKTLETELFDVLLLDLKIPGLTGFEILQWLKVTANPIKIIVVSGRPLKNAGHSTNFNAEEESLLTLASAVINKPSKIKYLIDVVATLAN